MEELAFRIGRSQAETVTMTYLGSEHEHWVEFRLDAVLSPFRCSYNVDTHGGDIAHFAQDLRHLHETLEGTAALHTLEHDVSVDASIDKFGHILWKIELNPGYDRPTLTAEVVEDQSMLPPLLEELDAVTEALRRDRALYETKTT